jgi:hypothetical protein
MTKPEEFDRCPLWKNPTPLFNIHEPRVTHVTQDGFATDPRERNDGWSILATQRLLNNAKYHDNILYMISAQLDLDPGIWEYQRSFLSRLFAQFFSATHDGPAWVIIAPRRITIESRQKTGYIVQSSSVYVSGTEVRGNATAKLKLGHNLTVDTEALAMAPRQGSRLNYSRFAHQQIRRELNGLDGRPLHRVHEDWTFLTVGSTEERADATAVRIPAMRQFFDPVTRIHTAGHISLNKLSKHSTGGRRMEAVSFDLYPREDRPTGDGKPGQIVAFRSMNYPMEFYLRTNVNNDILLRRSVTAGEWGDFPCESRST